MHLLAAAAAGVPVVVARKMQQGSLLLGQMVSSAPAAVAAAADGASFVLLQVRMATHTCMQAQVHKEQLFALNVSACMLGAGLYGLSCATSLRQDAHVAALLAAAFVCCGSSASASQMHNAILVLSVIPASLAHPCVVTNTFCHFPVTFLLLSML
jgi:hypothetical protein